MFFYRVAKIKVAGKRFFDDPFALMKIVRSSEFIIIGFSMEKEKKEKEKRGGGEEKKL